VYPASEKAMEHLKKKNSYRTSDQIQGQTQPFEKGKKMMMNVQSAAAGTTGGNGNPGSFYKVSSIKSSTSSYPKASKQTMSSKPVAGTYIFRHCRRPCKYHYQLFTRTLLCVFIQIFIHALLIVFSSIFVLTCLWRMFLRRSN
jgi:hypothetical protein